MHNFSTDQPNRHWRYIYLGAASALIFVAGLLFAGVPGLSFGLISTALYLGFKKYAWKWQFFHRHGLVEIPDLSGTWEGHIFTSRDPEVIDDEMIVDDGEQIDGLTKLETYLYIEQAWDEVQVNLGGPESSSASHAATILVNDKAWPTLTYNYLNDGSTTNDELDAHYGTASLEYHEDGDRLEGKYYNRPDQRGTHGVMKLSRKEE